MAEGLPVQLVKTRDKAETTEGAATHQPILQPLMAKVLDALETYTVTLRSESLRRDIGFSAFPV